MIRRRLFAILWAASLLLCAATCGLWMRAQWAGGYDEHAIVDFAKRDGSSADAPDRAGR